MLSTSSIQLKKPSAQQAVIIPFHKRMTNKKAFCSCIFCGNTIRVHTFKGKSVCIHCLHQIPTIFSYG